MRRVVLLGCLFLVLLGVAGCRSDNYSSIMKETLVQLDRLYFALDLVGQPSQLPSARKEVNAVQEELKKLKERLDRLPSESEAARAREERKYRSPIRGILKKLDGEVTRTGNDREVAAVVQYARDNLVPKEN